MFNMNRSAIMAIALSAIAFFSSSFASAVEGEKTVTLQENVAQAELIRLNIPAGDVEIMGTTGDSVTAVVTAVCQQGNYERCYQLVKEMAWSKKTGTVTELGLSPSSITRYDNITIKVKLGVPRDKKLDVNVSAGELRIEGTSACLNAEVNAGEAHIKLRESQLASFELNAKVGDVKLVSSKGETIEGERSMLVGAHMEWSKGTGACHANVSVLAGEAQLILN